MNLWTPEVFSSEFVKMMVEHDLIPVDNMEDPEKQESLRVEAEKDILVSIERGDLDQTKPMQPQLEKFVIGAAIQTVEMLAKLFL